MAKSWRPKWQNFREREWERIRDSWLEHTPRFPSIGAPPDPGLEGLSSLCTIQLPENHDQFPDVEGLRINALWEAVFLFHKCAHAGLATQRIGQSGMHSWSLFNAYHSAYLGARGIMTLLGVALPKINGNQVAIDLFPEPTTSPKPRMIRKSEKAKFARQIAVPKFQEFIIVRLDQQLDQRFLWEAFQSVINKTRSKCWDGNIRQNLTNLPFEKITPPRNNFLYKAHYWPLSDLIMDADPSNFDKLFGTELDVGEDGFLLRLCFSVYYLFDQLMRDLAMYSGVIRQQLDASRVFSSSNLAVLSSYKNFVAQVSAERNGIMGDARLLH